jgi:hypothetical protein
MLKARHTPDSKGDADPGAMVDAVAWVQRNFLSLAAPYGPRHTHGFTLSCWCCCGWL